MNKIFAYLACMLAITIIIAHDSIHHHHVSAGNMEVVNSHGSHEDDHHDDGGHFPPHQHILADADFYCMRNVSFGGKVFKHVQIELYAEYPSHINNINLLTSGFIRVFKDPPLLQPCSITPNLTRGSPAFS